MVCPIPFGDHNNTVYAIAIAIAGDCNN